MSTVDVGELRKWAKQARTAEDRARKLARVAVVKTAADTEADAKRLAPVDTGMLRNSIGSDIAGDGMSAEVGPTANYGEYVEYGTSRATPQPYMNPAFERRAPGFEKAIEQIVREVL